MFQKGFLDLVSAPQEGSGEECGADSFLDFGGAGYGKNKLKMVKSFYERF